MDRGRTAPHPAQHRHEGRVSRSAAISPHKLTRARSARHAPTSSHDQPQHRRIEWRRPAPATAPMSRAQAVTYCARSLLPIEKNAASNRSIASAAAGNLDHDAERRAPRRHAPRRKVGDGRVEQCARRLQFLGHRHHRQHDLQGSVHGGARQRAQLRAKKPRARASERRKPRTPRNGLASPANVSPAIGLSPPASSVRIVTGRPAAHSTNAAIGGVLRVLVGQRRSRARTEIPCAPGQRRRHTPLRA